jgi:hypothetical protein
VAGEVEKALARPPAEGEDARLWRMKNWAREREVAGKASETWRERRCHYEMRLTNCLRRGLSWPSPTEARPRG